MLRKQKNKFNFHSTGSWFACGVGTALISIFSATSAPAQNVNGILNFMGQMIENDMRNQQIRREQEAYDAQQRAIQAEQKRREVALVRRMQASLKTLGFYNSKIDGDRGRTTQAAEQAFRTAFNVPPIMLNEDDIRILEQLAAKGFRSNDELQRATTAGFEKRDDYLAAKAGGFANSRDYFQAQDLGLTTVTDFTDFRNSGFPSVSGFRQAKTAGFQNRTEFEAANSKGFATKNEYQQFVQSGLPDKATFLRKLDEAVAQRKLMQECQTASASGDLTRSLDLCIKAISAGNDPATVKLVLDRIGQDISQKLAELEKPAPAAELQQVSSTSAPPALSPEEIAGRKSAFLKALQMRDCAASVAGSKWQNAVEQCSVQEIADQPVVAQLKEKAQQQLASEQKAAEDEARRQRQEADAQKEKVALAQAQERLATLLSDVADFTASKPRLVKPLDLATAVVGLKSVQGSKDSRDIEQSILKMNGLLAAEPDYQNFVDSRQKAQDIAATNARTTALAQIERAAKFMEAYVSDNMLDNSVPDLLKLKTEIDGVLASKQDAAIFALQSKIQSEMVRLKLQQKLTEFVYEAQPEKQRSVEKAGNGIALTAENRPLLEGDEKDVLILGNFTKSAPHLVVNLMGEVKFYGNNLDYCWYRSRDDGNGLSPDVVAALQGLGGQNLSDRGNCRATDGLQYDAVILERGDFLQGNVLDTTGIIDAFSATKLKVLQSVRASDIGANRAQMAATATQIRSEVLASAREGFGFIRLENSSPNMCLVIDPASRPFHDQLMADAGDQLGRLLVSVSNGQATSAELAFALAQKDQCGAIYAASTDMRQILVGLERQNIAHAVLPLWFQPADLDRLKALSAQRQASEKQRLAGLKQEQEASALLAKKNADEASVRRAREQAALRDKYSQEAKAAFNDVSQDSEAMFRKGQSLSGRFEQLFPKTVGWAQSQARDSWTLDKYSDSLVEYGTASWKGRRLEAVVTQVQLVNKNAVRGEYASACFIVGYLIDSEFNVRRDAFEAGCDSSAWKDWANGRAFESRWTVQ
jgi:hypothetical protein